MRAETSAFIRLTKHPVKFRLFLFYRLPSAFFSGVRIREISEEECQVTVPYSWFSQNPFRSTYFACLSMAAEMSTGSLAMAHSFKSQPAISMLVVKMESTYSKKATGLTVFQCKDGLAIRDTIRMAAESGEARTLATRSVGLDASGETIAEFLITWSFKARSTPGQAKPIPKNERIPS